MKEEEPTTNKKSEREDKCGVGKTDNEIQYIFKLLINETNLIWQKLGAFLIMTSILVVGFVETSGILKILISIGGIIFTILLFVTVKISWNYHDNRWEQLKKYSDLDVFKEKYCSEGVRARDVMYII